MRDGPKSLRLLLALPAAERLNRFQRHVASRGAAWQCSWRHGAKLLVQTPSANVRGRCGFAEA